MSRIYIMNFIDCVQKSIVNFIFMMVIGGPKEVEMAAKALYKKYVRGESIGAARNREDNMTGPGGIVVRTSS